MIKKLSLLACAASFVALPLLAQDAKPEYPSPPEIVAKAKAEEWVAIAPSDLLVMDLTLDGKGKARRVIIQLMPAPFSQGWVGNIRKLAAAKWWDGTAVVRVQDNYVAQWGDPTEKKALPEGLAVVPEREYVAAQECSEMALGYPGCNEEPRVVSPWKLNLRSPYDGADGFWKGWPLATNSQPITLPKKATSLARKAKLANVWPIHCYAMVGVGRNLSPDTGTGAELYTVIGHAPRHLDRNIALVGRVIEGMEHLSSLPRGTGPLGFYEQEEERVPITSVRLGNEIPDLPAFEYLSTESASFAAYADARANRRDPFFIMPAGGADICNIPVPVRRKV
jgi:cyclophilin family peptidyl-prolyl cis-trans isomerase